MIPSIDLTFDDVNSVDSSYVHTYLVDSGWQEESRLDDRAIIFTRYKNQEKYSILLPIDKEIPDFCSRMYDVLRTLEVTEGKSKVEILELLKTPHQLALEHQTDIIGLRFRFIDYESKERFPVRKIGALLVSLGDLLDAVGRAELEQDSIGDTIPKEISIDGILAIEILHGFFGVRLAFAALNQQTNFVHLLNSLDRENLKQTLLHLKRKIISEYRKFLVELIRAKSNLYIDWGSINPQVGGHTYLSYEDAISTVEFIDEFQSPYNRGCSDNASCQTDTMSGENRLGAGKIKKID